MASRKSPPAVTAERGKRPAQAVLVPKSARPKRQARPNAKKESKKKVSPIKKGKTPKVVAKPVIRTKAARLEREKRSAAAKRGWETRRANLNPKLSTQLKKLLRENKPKADGNNVVRYNSKWKTINKYRRGSHINKLVNEVVEPSTTTSILYDIMEDAKKVWKPGQYLRIMMNTYFYGAKAGRSARNLVFDSQGMAFGFNPVGTGENSTSLKAFEIKVEAQLAELEKITKTVHILHDYTIKSYKDLTVPQSMKIKDDTTKVIKWK